MPEAHQTVLLATVCLIGLMLVWRVINAYPANGNGKSGDKSPSYWKEHFDRIEVKQTETIDAVKEFTDEFRIYSARLEENTKAQHQRMKELEEWRRGLAMGRG